MTMKAAVGEGSTEAIWENEWKELFGDSDAQTANPDDKASTDDLKKRKKSKAKSKKFLQSKSKRQKSSSSSTSSQNSQPESEANGSLPSPPPGDSTDMATNDDSGDKVTSVPETDAIKNEDDVETKSTKSEKDDDNENKADSKNTEDEDGKDGETKNVRTVSSKSEGEGDDKEDEEIDFPDGAVSSSPVKANTLPAITSSPTLSPATPTSADKKKRKFQPFKSIRKLFNKKRPKDEDTIPTQSLSKSTGHLDQTVEEEDDLNRSKSVSPSLLKQRPMSMSEDSVFSSPEPVEDTRPVTPASKPFTNELASKLQHRSPNNPSITVEGEKVVPLPFPELSESRDSGVILEDEKLQVDPMKKTKSKLLNRPWKSFTSSSSNSAVAAKKKIEQKKLQGRSSSETFDIFDSITSNSNLLVSDAARHRISIKPKRNRRPPSRLRPAPLIVEEEEELEKPSPLSSPGLPTLNVPKENQPVQRSNSDKKEITRTPSNASTKDVNLDRKPSKEKTAGPPVVIKRKDSKEKEEDTKQSLFNKSSNDAGLPDVQEASDIKGKQPLARTASKERATSPPTVQQKGKQPLVRKSSKERATSPPTVQQKRTSLPEVEEKKDSKTKDSEINNFKPWEGKKINRVKAPVKLPVVEPKSNTDTVTVKRNSSKTESDIVVKEEEKENKAPSPVPDNKDSKSEVKVKKVPSFGASKTESEPEPVSAKLSSVKPHDKVDNEDKQSEKAAAEEKKRPVTPPKPRKQIPANRPDSTASDQSDDKSTDGDAPPAKPLSLKERMAMLNNAAAKNGAKDNNKPATPAWKKQTPPKPAASKQARPNSPKNVIIQVTEGQKSSPVENSKKEESKTSSNSGNLPSLNRQRTPSRKAFTPKTEKCIVCDKSVYLTEMAKADGKTFHKACQKCTECKRMLLIGNILMVSGQIFCKLHGTQEKNKILKKRLEFD